MGSVPAAFAGVLVLRGFGSAGRSVDGLVQVALGVALLLAVVTMVAKAVLALRRHAMAVQGAGRPAQEPLRIRPLATVVVGVIGGIVVGMTSVGSGSLIIVSLLVLYPQLRAGQLVGTDLVQAVPLVASAALGHALFGDVELGLTAWLLIGALPGVWLGAQLSSRAPQMLVRRALALVLLASGLKLVGVPTDVVAVVLIAAAVTGPLAWMGARRAVGLPARWRVERAQSGRQAPVAAAPAADAGSLVITSGRPTPRQG